MHASLNRIRPSSLNSQFSLPYASCRRDVIARPTIDKSMKTARIDLSTFITITQLLPFNRRVLPDTDASPG